MNKQTITVGELIAELGNMPLDAKVYLATDRPTYEFANVGIEKPVAGRDGVVIISYVDKFQELKTLANIQQEFNKKYGY